MDEKNSVRFFSIFFAATAGVILEIIAVLVDEIVVGNLFTDDAFASVNLIEPYTFFQTFLCYLIAVGAAALIVRAHGANDKKRMEEIFGQTMIVCAIVGAALTSFYVLFTRQLVDFVADEPSVFENALSYFNAMRFYPLVDMFDTFLFTYVLYRGGFIHFYLGIFCRIGLNAILSWYLGSQMGLFGVGLASILSLLIAVMIKLTFLFTKKHGLKFRWYFNLRDMLSIAWLGFPESSLYVFIVIMELAINRFTLSYYGVTGVAAVAVVVNVFEFVLYLSEGISEYEIVAVNDSIGKNSSVSMDHSIKVTKRAAWIEGLVLIGLILLSSGILPEAFDIDRVDTAELATKMLILLSPVALFICLTRITAIFYQYTKRIPRTIMLFGLAIAALPSLFGILLGLISVEWIAVGMAMGPIMAIVLIYGYVHLVKKEKVFDYNLIHLK